MKKRICLISLVLSLIMTGCGNIVLERSFSNSSPHSDTYWENEGTDTLRADSYPDLVNALMLLLTEHTEDATVRLYGEEIDASALMEKATNEVQQETALGSYLLDYITYTLSEETAYTSAAVHLSYRRSTEEQQSIINATSTEALPDLVRLASEQGQSAVAVRIGYFSADRNSVRESVSALQQELAPTEPPWAVNFYPDSEEAGIVEILFEE